MVGKKYVDSFSRIYIMIDLLTQQTLREQYNPEGSSLRRLQLQMLDILIEFDRICQKHQIPYWLDAGTLLGAVRHGGFIPWDDDLDICMSRRDYDRFRQVCVDELAAPYKLRDVGAADNNYSYWAKIVDETVVVRRKLTNPTRILQYNIWLDIFVVESGSVDTKRRIEPIYGKCLRRKNKQIIDGRLNYILAILFLPIINGGIRLLRLWNRVVHKDEYIYTYGVPFYPKHLKEYTFPLSSISFEGHRFCAPSNPDGYLRTFYGDYESIPSVEKRITHDFMLD